MRKGTALILGAVLLISLGLLPFLCSHCAILPQQATAYYQEKAARDAQNAQGAEAELMRLLLGGAAQAPAPAAAREIPFYWYGLGLALSGVLGVAVMLLRAPAQKQLGAVLWGAAALAAPLALVGARLFYCAASAGFYLLDIENPLAMLKVWEGGLSLTGALCFAALAGMIAARIGGQKALPVLNAMTPGLLVFAAGARLCEGIIGAGFGPEMPFSLPLLTQTVNGVARLNTAWIMALCALLLLPLSRRSFVSGCFLYAGTLLLLESLRRDGHLLWGFVHAEQLFALLIALASLICLKKPRKRVLPALALTLLLSAAIVLLEFALDRSNIGDGLLYLAYAALVGGYLAWGCACAKPRSGV